MSGERRVELRVVCGTDLAKYKEKEPPFWLAYLRVLKELAWTLDRGPRRDEVHGAMERAREHWLRGDQ